MVNKKCSLCLVEKPLSAFYAHPYAADGLKSNCKTCHNKTSNNWGKKNIEARRLAGRNFYSRNRLECIRKVRDWEKNNYEAHRAMKGSLELKRRAVKLKATPSWADFGEIRHLYALAKELSMLDGIQYHVDHIVPLNSKYVCGLHVEANLRVIGAQENFNKRNWTWPDMWDKS